MRFPLWANPTNNPSATAERFITPEGVMAWATTDVNGRFPVPPGGGVVRKLEVKLGVAPGVGKSWRVSYVVNGVEVEATRVTIKDAATSGKWTGELSLKAGDTFCILIAPSGEPTLPGLGTEGTAFFTSVETTGDTFWVAGGGGTGSVSNAVASYNPPFGINSAGWQLTEGLSRVVIPGKFKLKGVAVNYSGVPGTGASYTLYARKNRTEDTLPVKVEGAGTSSATAEGTVQFNAGETLEIKCVPGGGPTARSCRYAYAIETEVSGEIFAAGMNAGVDAATEARATYPDTWKSTWNASTQNRLLRPAALKMERLYVEIGTAPGAGKSRTYALTLNGVTQALKAKIEGASTSSNDTTHSFTTDGTALSLLAEPAGTPAENIGGVHWGFIVIVPQPAELEAAASGSGSASTDLHGVASMETAFVGSGAVDGALGGLASMEAQPQGQGSVSGELGVVASMSGVLSGAGTLGVEVRAVSTLTAVAGGSGALTAELEAVVHPHATSLSLSTRSKTSTALTARPKTSVALRLRP